MKRRCLTRHSVSPSLLEGQGLIESDESLAQHPPDNEMLSDVTRCQLQPFGVAISNAARPQPLADEGMLSDVA